MMTIQKHGLNTGTYLNERALGVSVRFKLLLFFCEPLPGWRLFLRLVETMAKPLSSTKTPNARIVSIIFFPGLLTSGS